MTGPQTDSAHVTLDAIVVLPPPAEGQTLVTERICHAFETALPFRLRAVRNRAGLPGLLWRLSKHLLLMAHLARGALVSRGRRRAYFVPDSNLGLWLNLLEAPLLRIGYRDVWLHHHVFRYVRHADWRMRAFLRILGPKTYHVVLGEAMANGLRSHYGATQFHVLGNAGFVEDVPPATQRTSLRTIGFLSNITPEKGIGLFMQTLRAVQAEDPEIACLIAGPIKDQALRAQVEAFCAEDPARRSWLGPVYAADKAAFFGRIDLLLFPSQYDNEALPVTICEALASGAPVLATDRGCIPDQLAGTGWTYTEDAFSLRAQSQISNWRSDELSFARASASAASRYAAQSHADTSALDHLTKRMATT
jgi:glycosyltransferase involved in cell wall biosynthesis